MNRQQTFFSQYLPYARRVSQMTGLDPRLVLAQAAIETGYGESAPNFNFFGIKAPQGQGASLLTSEFENGQMVQRNEPFRTYQSPEESFTDYARFVTENPRYRSVLEAETLADQIAAMGASGYATDPNYGNLLSQVASSINLDSPEMIGSDTMAALGRGNTMDGLLGTPPMGAQPSLGMFQQQQPQQRQPFFGPDFRDRLTIALEGLSMRPNTSLMQMAQGNIQQRREEQQTMQQRNATADWLESQGMGQYADAVRRGIMTGQQAFEASRSEAATAQETEQLNATRAAAAEWLRANGGDAGNRVATLVERGIMSLEDAMKQIESPDPQSAIAKLAADRRNNLITEEEYQVGLQNLTPSGMSIETTPDGGVRLVQGPGAGAAGGGLNVTEGQNLGFAIRARGALEDLEPVANALADPVMRAADIDPTGAVRGTVQSEEYQIARNAGDEFLQALLRKDTGAAITEQEQVLYGRTYLPQPGDTPAVLEQKARARARAVAALEAGLPPEAILRLEGVEVPSEPQDSGSTNRIRFDAEGNIIND